MLKIFFFRSRIYGSWEISFLTDLLSPSSIINKYDAFQLSISHHCWIPNFVKKIRIMPGKRNYIKAKVSWSIFIGPVVLEYCIPYFLYLAHPSKSAALIVWNSKRAPHPKAALTIEKKKKSLYFLNYIVFSISKFFHILCKIRKSFNNCSL